MAGKKEGKCNYCDGVFGKTAMAKHVNLCRVKRDGTSSVINSGGSDYYCLSIQGRYSPEYWMYLDIDAKASLDELDGFLRSKWLECCGHMRVFNVGGYSYTSMPDKSMGDKSMAVKLENILQDIGMKFDYEYDFGSTTSLQLKVVSERSGAKRKGKIEMMARNLPITHQCSYCDKTAEQICCECIYEDSGFLCESCTKTHECGEDMQLPVVNSPRMGVCGYTGWD